MVWGICKADSFGMYFPETGYVGYKETLQEVFDATLTAEERASYNNRLATFSHAISRKFTEDMGPLKEFEKPKCYKFKKSYSKLGSLIIVLNRLLLVDEDFKKIIEALEPDTHQFWPIRLITRKNHDFPTKFYGMIVLRHLDSFNGEASDPGSWKIKDFFPYPYLRTKEYIKGLAFSKDIIGSAHMWREQRLRSPDIFISDAVQSEISRLGLKAGKMYEMKEV